MAERIGALAPQADKAQRRDGEGADASGAPIQARRPAPPRSRLEPGRRGVEEEAADGERAVEGLTEQLLAGKDAGE